MDCGSCASCGHWVCGRWRPLKKLFFGLFLLLNAFVWPLWSGIDGWVTWAAVLLTVGAVVSLFRAGTACGQGSCCSTSSVCAPVVAKKKKR